MDDIVACRMTSLKRDRRKEKGKSKFKVAAVEDANDDNTLSLGKRSILAGRQGLRGSS